MQSRNFARSAWRVSARADRVVVVAHERPGDPDRPYDPAQLAARLAAELGSTPEWSPVGPIVRDALAGARVPLTPFDWHHVLDADAWVPRQPRPVRPPSRRVLGRHARDDARAWPEDPAALLAAYPDSPERRAVAR